MPHLSPSEGTRDKIAKVVDILMRVDMVILFSLAMVKTKSKVKRETNSNLHFYRCLALPLALIYYRSRRWC